jgi:hypothetical protein
VASVAINSSPVQYSDVVTFVATITSPTAQAELNTTGGTVEFKLKSSAGVITSLGSSASADWNSSNGTVTKQLAIMQAPGTYTVIAVFTPGNTTNFQGSTNINCGALVVNQENARIDYTGDIIKATATASTTTATVTLRANIFDISAINSSDPQFDSYAGDIRNAKVRFVNRDAADAPISDWIPVTTLVNNADAKVGTVSAPYNMTVGADGSTQATIGIIVDNGYYIRDEEADNVIVTIYQPNGDFITGGGYITTTKCVGSMKGDDNSRTHFGFNVKFTRKGTNLQGSLNFIFRRTVGNVQHVYQVKSNAMQSLGVNATNLKRQTATFVSKGNITDITNPLNPIAMGGNKYMYINMIDNGEPAVNDSISFVLVDGTADPTVLANIMYSSNWIATKTEMMNLTGGNLVVHSGFNLGGNEQIVPKKIGDLQLAPVNAMTRFDATAYPNPTTSQFNIKLESSNRQDEISIVVYSVNGKVVEQRQHLSAGQTIQLGGLYRPGVYILEMIQGNQRKQLKLVKIPD